MARHLLRLTQANRQAAHQWVDKAIMLGNGGKPWMLEVKEPKRSLEQNRLLHAVIGEIAKKRPIHNGTKMDVALWKACFMQAMGEEVRFIPTLSGDGVFPVGLKTRDLTTPQFSELIEFIYAWCAREGIDIGCNHVTES